MPSVDVVVPSYQYARYLRGCVRSALDQDGVSVRVLIIDNASTDGSAALARALAAEDPRVEAILRPANLGPHASFNEGIAWASADYFLILCADDLLAPGALARATAIMGRHPNVHLTYGRTVLFNGEEAPASPSDMPAADPGWRVVGGRDLIERFCRTGRNHCPGPSCVVRTRIQKAVGFYRPALAHTDDLELWMRFACHGDAAETDAVQAFARVHTHNQSASVGSLPSWDLEFEAAFDSFFANEGAGLADHRRLARRARRSLGERAYWSALAHIARGELRTARELAGLALRLTPDAMLVPPVWHLARRAEAPRRIAETLGLIRRPAR
ncbi:glycosyltransferase family A protein [Bosea sp. 117]|uniref:glycosyltransferase family 2 protein n=1 Tax=Bosea sp. 117 TaxID=1125973 RepID=UPI0004947E7F|nr:glycosyltransferase family A protein [Bosea sp. 117]